VKRGGFVVLWDHNPANPYWPILMKRVPQDSGDERLVPLAEILADTRAAGLREHAVFRSGFTPDFLPASLAGVWGWVERAVDASRDRKWAIVLEAATADKVLSALRYEFGGHEEKK